MLSIINWIESTKISKLIATIPTFIKTVTTTQ